MEKRFNLIFTVVYQSQDMAGDAYINKVYKAIKDYILANTPYSTFYHDTKKQYSEMIDVCKNMRLENVEEKYMRSI